MARDKGHDGDEAQIEKSIYNGTGSVKKNEDGVMTITVTDRFDEETQIFLDPDQQEVVKEVIESDISEE